MSNEQDIITYLQSTGRIGVDEQPRVRELAGGVSNFTLLIERDNGEAWVLKKALSKLRVKADWYCDPIRIHREADGLRWLEKLAPPGTITPLIFEDHHEQLLAMQAVPQPHETWKTLLLQGQLDPDHIRQFAELLAAIHRGGHERRDELSKVFADTQFFETLRLEPYYSYAAEQVPKAKPFIEQLITETRTRHETVVHGDYSPKNILVHNNKLILIDHEAIHFGAAAFDLGFSMTHLISKAHHLPAHREAFARAVQQYWTTYRTALGDVPFAHDLEAFAVRHTLGCMLGRSAGRSQLEYLDTHERTQLRDITVGLMQRGITEVGQLIETWMGAL